MVSVSTLGELSVARLTNAAVDHTETQQSLRSCNLSGRLTELSGGASASSLVPVCTIIREAQLLREPVAWISQSKTIFFPPDMVDNGIDVEALPVIRTPHLKDAIRVADHLLRSSAFGLIILDLDATAGIDQGILGRLIKLSKKHNTAIICLTTPQMRNIHSLGSMVSLRGETSLKRIASNVFYSEVDITKDKKHGAGWKIGEVCFGPDGLY